MATSPSLTLIVAATAKNGIGKGGGLPWPMLKKEMAYFARITKRVPQGSAPGTLQNGATTDGAIQNVVIMGRKTWDSIPTKLRPLKQRTNIVITRQSPDSVGIPQHEDVIVAGSIEQGIQKLQQRAAESKGKAPGRFFIIGGAGIYGAALKLPTARTILLTRIQKDYECDTLFPVDVEAESQGAESWRRASNAELSRFVGEEVSEQEVEEVVDDEAVRYQFTMYEKS